MRTKYFLEGRVFGKLTVLKLNPENSGVHRTWLCECECGKIFSVIQTHLIQGNSISCGCSKIKSAANGFLGYGDIHLTRFSDIKKQAKERNYEFNLTIEFLWDLFLKQDKKCALSGMELEFGKKSKQYGTASLDRIDNKIGYINTNVWWVHKDINKMKNIHSLDYFLQLCEKITLNNSNF